MYQKYDAKKMARAQARDASVSFKKSLMIANQLRGMMSDKAEAFLERVENLEQPVKFTRFRDGAGHRSGFGPAKYPVKAASAFLNLIQSAVANAETKGLGVPLKIIHIACNQASKPMHQGSRRSQSMKRTHIEIVLVETDESRKREKKVKKAKETKEPVETAKEDAQKITEKSAPKEKKPEEKKAQLKSTETPIKKTAETEAKPIVKEKDAPAKKSAKAESKKPNTEEQ